MFHVEALTDTSGAYFLDDPAREVGDLFEERSSGTWIGRGSALFGLQGSVERSVLQSVLAGRPLGATIFPDPRRQRSGFDILLAPPKPVSVLFAAYDRSIARSVVRSHERAVDATIGYLEQRAVGIGRREPGSDERVVLPIDGLVAARFTHGVSRSADPHLHSHVVVANFARESSGRFGALDTRGLKAHAQAADALYRAQLRRELRISLGVVWEDGRDGREQIAGVSDGVVLAFSGRSAEVRSGEVNRPPKSPVRSRAEVESVWEERRVLAPCISNQPRSTVRVDVLDEHRFGGLIAHRAPKSRDVVHAWADSARGGIDASVVARALSNLSLDLGRGVSEATFSPRHVLPGRAALREIGSRPVNAVQLDAWWRRRDELERARSITSSRRAISGHARDEVAPDSR